MLARLLMLLVLLALPAASFGAVPEQAVIRRFALVAASDDGGPGRARLRYARSDAKAFEKVLHELGGVNPNDSVLLIGADRADFHRGIEQLSRKLIDAKTANGRLELLVYYSGHSDEAGLLLGDEKLSYSEFRAMLNKLPADVRIAVLDSCSSGALTRAKGGTKRAPFLMDVSANIKGHAFLTSSSADEVSQESDRIAASFFTHSLVSGLRGGADFNRDSRVTLNEAYQFAFNETLARTEKTRGGAQHAAYDIELSGAGDLVLTDLRQTAAALLLAEHLRGRVFIRDMAGALVVELNKFSGHAVDIGLEPGRYRVLVERDGSAFEAVVELVQGKQTLLGDKDLKPAKIELTALRGATAETAQPIPAPKNYKVFPATFTILPRVSTDGVEGDDEVNYFSFNLLAGHAGKLQGAEVAFGINSRSDKVEGAQLAYGANLAGFGWWSPEEAPGEVGGAQLSFGTNLARGRVRGAQMSFGMNGAGNTLEGAQTAFGANYAARVRGAQLAFGANVVGWEFGKLVTEAAEGDVKGAQLAFGANFARGDVALAQAAFGANFAGGDVSGGQLAFGANIARADVTGIQFAYGANSAAGLVRGAQAAFGANCIKQGLQGAQASFGANYSGAITGVQASHGFNMTQRLRGIQVASGVNLSTGLAEGAQIGIVNIGDRVKGLQLGLFNYNDDITGAAIGLVSISRRHPVRFVAWTDDVNLLSLGAKFGSKYVYNLLYVGGHVRDQNRWSVGWGLGARLPLDPWFVNFDGAFSTVRFRGDLSWNELLQQYRLTAGRRISKRLAFYAGPTYNLYYSKLGGKSDRDISPMPDRQSERDVPWPNRQSELDVFKVRRWPGFVLGIEI